MQWTKKPLRYIYVQRFTGDVSAHLFLHTFILYIYKNYWFGHHSMILLLQYKFGFPSHLLSYFIIFLREGLIYEESVKVISYYYLVIKSNF